MKEYEILEDCALRKAKFCLIAQPQKRKIPKSNSNQ